LRNVHAGHGIDSDVSSSGTMGAAAVLFDAEEENPEDGPGAEVEMFCGNNEVRLLLLLPAPKARVGTATGAATVTCDRSLVTPHNTHRGAPSLAVGGLL
jgi:hypothetical protein